MELEDTKVPHRSVDSLILGKEIQFYINKF